jgi:PAS domain S-box-containing protein
MSASNDIANTPETAEHITEILSDSSYTARRTPTMKMRILALFITLVIGALAFLGTSFFLNKEESRLEGNLASQIELMVIERSTILSTWLNSLTGQSRPLVQSEVMRSFVMAVDQVDGDLSKVLNSDQSGNTEGDDEADFSDQVPFMVNAMTDLVRDGDFSASYVIDRQGQPFLTSVDALPLLGGQKSEALKVFDTKKAIFGDFRTSARGLELDIYTPIHPTQFSSVTDDVIGVFVLTAAIDKTLDALLQPNPISGLAGHYKLFQRNFQGNIESVTSVAGGDVYESKLSSDIFSRGDLPFGTRVSFDGKRDVYSFGSRLGDTDFFLAWETDTSVARADFEQLKINSYLIAIFFMLTFFAVMVAFWWRFNSDRNEMLAKQYGEFASQVSRQKKLLDSVNNTISEFITVKDSHGVYTYANPSFAKAMGRQVDDLVGLDDEAVFGHGTAERLRRLDEMAQGSNQPVAVVDEIYLRGHKKNLQISKVPITLDGENGIVTVTRDITELVNEQERREKSIKQTVAALVKAVEMRDPHLAGHSRRVADFAVAVGHSLSTDPKLQRTLETAANLCQIGKLDVPEDLLRADRRLNDKEIKIIQQHIVSAEKIVSDIDFDVPVTAAIGQMYERLDGSGYPRQIKEDDICLEARILGICDYFCARIENRSYRQGISPEEALSYLEQNANKYDPRVVQALKEVVVSSQGEKIIASIQASK